MTDPSPHDVPDGGDGTRGAPTPIPTALGADTAEHDTGEIDTGEIDTGEIDTGEIDIGGVAGTSRSRDITDEIEVPTDEPGNGLPPAARAFFDWVLVVGIALMVAIGVRTFVLAHFAVEGSSMISTLQEGDRVFVNRLSYRFGEPSRGDVVVLHQISGTTERDLIKRVVGLPGEAVAMRDCVVTIDGRELIEPYLDPAVVTPARCGQDFEPVVVPDDHVWVMGDNRPGSQDSRSLGVIPYDDLVGRAFVVFWPRSDWRWL